MGVGGDLVEPMLAAGQHLNGEILSKIFTQRTVWLVPKEKLSVDELQEEVIICHFCMHLLIYFHWLTTDMSGSGPHWISLGGVSSMFNIVIRHKVPAPTLIIHSFETAQQKHSKFHSKLLGNNFLYWSFVCGDWHLKKMQAQAKYSGLTKLTRLGKDNNHYFKKKFILSLIYHNSKYLVTGDTIISNSGFQQC